MTDPLPHDLHPGALNVAAAALWTAIYPAPPWEAVHEVMRVRYRRNVALVIRAYQQHAAVQDG